MASTACSDIATTVAKSSNIATTAATAGGIQQPLPFRSKL
jgi:hypothetical protein